MHIGLERSKRMLGQSDRDTRKTTRRCVTIERGYIGLSIDTWFAIGRRSLNPDPYFKVIPLVCFIKRIKKRYQDNYTTMETFSTQQNTNKDTKLHANNCRQSTTHAWFKQQQGQTSAARRTSTLQKDWTPEYFTGHSHIVDTSMVNEAHERNTGHAL